MRHPRPTRLDQYRAAATGSTHTPAPVDVTRERGSGADRSPTRMHPAVLLVFWSVLGAVGACAALGFGAPAIRDDWDWPVFVAGTGAAGISLLAVRRHAQATSARTRRFVVGGAASVVCLFGIGAVTQLELAGKPQLAISAPARAHDIVNALYADILQLRDADTLIGYEQADARARFNDYEPAIAELRSIANRWSRTDLGALPDPDLIDVVQGVKVAATFGAEALAIRFRIITEPDDRSTQALIENRTALYEATLASAAGLKPLAERYQVDVGIEGRGE